MDEYILFALISGTCGAAASFFGKLSGLQFLEGWLFILRVVFFSLMLLANGGVWTFYVKALQASDNSIGPTVISATANYLLSALAGILIFGEMVSVLWWAGISLILLGLILVVKGQPKDDSNRIDTKIQ